MNYKSFTKTDVYKNANTYGICINDGEVIEPSRVESKIGKYEVLGYASYKNKYLVVDVYVPDRELHKVLG